MLYLFGMFDIYLYFNICTITNLYNILLWLGKTSSLKSKRKTLLRSIRTTVPLHNCYCKYMKITMDCQKLYNIWFDCTSSCLFFEHVSFLSIWSIIIISITMWWDSIQINDRSWTFRFQYPTTLLTNYAIEIANLHWKHS